MSLRDIHNAISRGTRGLYTKVQGFKHDAAIETKYVDLTIHFIGARELPKSDVVGGSDPYFVARLDHQIEYTYVSMPFLPVIRLTGVTGHQ